MEQVNNLEKDIEKLDKYIEYLEEQKIQLEKDILKKMLIEELKNTKRRIVVLKLY